jgi:hypothetical protein
LDQLTDQASAGTDDTSARTEAAQARIAMTRAVMPGCQTGPFVVVPH